VGIPRTGESSGVPDGAVASLVLPAVGQPRVVADHDVVGVDAKEGVEIAGPDGVEDGLGHVDVGQGPRPLACVGDLVQLGNLVLV